MSLPWILADHILDTKDPRMMEYLLFPMDLYNDSADWALTHFKQRYLFEELEAEVNLVFDQLTFKLSEQVFSYYKHLAASIYLDRTFRERCKKKGMPIPYPPKNRYATLLRQRSIKILGREVDINRLVSQRMNANFLRSLGDAIKRFEASDLTAIVELDALVEINRLAYRLLSEHFEMASFDSLLSEVNHKISSDYGRITLHLFYELYLDFLPHYCYNSATNRYVTTALAFAEKTERGKAKSPKGKLWGNELLAKCFSQFYSRYSTFMGEPHFDAITKFLDYQDVALVINELMKVIKTILTDSIKPYTVMLTSKGVFPDKCMLPRYDYTSPGILTYFKAQFDPILRYTHLQTNVFQSFREIGNAVLFCLHLEHALSRREIPELKHAAIFQSIIPKPHIASLSKEKAKDAEARAQRDAQLQKKMEQLKTKYRGCHIIPVLGKKGSKEQLEYAQESSLLAREKLCIGLSMFEMVLTKLKTFLDQDKEVWEKPEAPSEDAALHIDKSRDFHRLWSAMQFIFCIPTGANQLNVEQLFGDSLNWGGLTLIALLGQYRRFQVTDFCYHLHKVHQVDNLGGDKVGDKASDPASARGLNVRTMATRIRRVQTLNDQIFTTLNKYLHQPTDSFSHLFNAHIHHFDPPKPRLGDIPEPEVIGTPSPEVEMRKSGRFGEGIRDSVDLIEDDFGDEDDHTQV